MTTVLDGKALAATIRGEVAVEVAALLADGGRPPGLAAVLVGGDAASALYVASKARACEEVGMVGRTHHLPEETHEEDLLTLLDHLNVDDDIDGILVQLPLPSHISSRKILDRVHPAKDVDGFHPVNVGRLWLDEPGFLSATPAGVMELLRRHDVPLAGAHAVVLGRSNIVGKPMAALLVRSHCTVTLCH
jgi:methylenetetrahydrofolate dehydrogenase (NADP+)/methenyltetrahydrofolate cyclohydrolase